MFKLCVTFCFILCFATSLALSVDKKSRFQRFAKSVVVSSCLLGGFVHQPIVAQALDDKVAVKRFEASLDVLTNLDKNWDSITKGNGDNIRRKLGTVYAPPSCDSPLCNFPNFVTKFVKAHPDDLEVDTFEEPIAEVGEAINQADFLAYSSMFSEYGNGGNGEDFMGNAHTQVQRAIANLKLVVIDLKRQSN
jgi:hypothetical protein